MKPTNLIMMRSLHSVFSWQTLLVLPWLIITASCTNLGIHSSIGPPPDRYGSMGYIPVENLPNTLAILPPPPPDDSIAFKFDQEMSRKSFALRDTLRWELATLDNMDFFPEPVNAFSCSLDAPITENDTPHLYRLLLRIFDDVDWFDKPVKDHYQRPRPFFVNKQPRCGTVYYKRYISYPSGTAALGMAYALILSEIAPDKTEALLARGLAYSETTVICNINWYSDVLAGRILGAALVARLHAEPQFLEDLEAAKEELTAIRAKGLSPERDCDAEAAALALSLADTP